MSPRRSGEPVLTYVTDATFAAYHEAVTRGFQENPNPAVVEFDRPMMENDRFFGFTVGDRWIATSGAFTRQLIVPGGTAVPTAAVTVVTVHPPYRRRGLLSAMMRHQLEDVAGRGEPFAALWASEALIYGRFGYAPATSRAILTGRNRRLSFLPDVVTGGEVDEVTREQFLPVASALFDAQVSQRPGAMRRGEHEWNVALFDLESMRDGATELRYVVHYDEAGDADGYAVYRFKNDWEVSEPAGEVRISAVTSTDPVAYATLWRYLLDLDLARKFRYRLAATDEPLRHLVTDARAVQTEITDNLYLRIVDVAAALGARTYRAEIDLVVEVSDPLLSDNTGCYRIVTSGSPGAATAEVSRTDRRPDVSLGVLELAAAYLGGTPLAHLHGAGRAVVEHTAGAVQALSDALGWHRAPLCQENF